MFKMLKYVFTQTKTKLESFNQGRIINELFKRQKLKKKKKKRKAQARDQNLR